MKYNSLYVDSIIYTDSPRVQKEQVPHYETYTC